MKSVGLKSELTLYVLVQSRRHCLTNPRLKTLIFELRSLL
jgi:hypothetical protein